MHITAKWLHQNFNLLSAQTAAVCIILFKQILSYISCCNHHYKLQGSQLPSHSYVNTGIFTSVAWNTQPGNEEPCTRKHSKDSEVLPSVACHQNTFWKGAEGSAAKSKPSLQLSCSENQWGFGIPRYRDSGLQTLLYNQSQIRSFQMLQNRDSALYYWFINLFKIVTSYSVLFYNIWNV